ncbi:MAG TPA: gliding motility-associated C-terminal domain-containing protein [Brumimicrobium sp.]|nr:gliding motility-associated C-terminal domain-containing protein [Brumimicrobium sp.]
MKENRIYIVLGLFVLFLSGNVKAQNFVGCPSVDAGEDVNIDCTETCVTLTANPFHAGNTDTYVVESIPYAPPIPFNHPGGTAVSVNTDDVWSPLINLPFDFCFYGQTYTQAKIGSNGAISLGNVVGTYHPYSFDAPIPTNNLGASSNPGNIFGVYHDMEPGTQYGGQVKYHLLGEAPCRVLVVTFDNLPHFGTSCRATLRSSSMIVLHEVTNTIEVYVKRKDLCMSWRDGRAVMGIMPNGGGQGIAPPGRNTGQWTVDENSPEAWRFIPNGTPIYTTEWLDEDDNVISTDLSIDVCPTVETTYKARVTYTSCTGGLPIVVEDEVVVTPSLYSPITVDNPVVVDATFEAVSCHGVNDGEIVVNASVGAQPYIYYLNGGSPQSSNVFTDLPSGEYFVTVVDDSGCVRNTTVNLIDPGTIGLDGSTTNLSCFEYNDGSASLTHTGGTDPLTYSINGGVDQSNPVFSDLPAGTYQFIATDANGCQDSVVKVITQPNAPTSHISMTDSVFCAEGTVTIETTGVSNGNFSATPSGLIISSISGLINLQNSQPGTYDVVYSFTESGCAYKDTFQIRVIGSSNLGVPNYIDLCIGESWTPNAQGADNFVWSGGLVNGEPAEGILGTFTYYVSGSVEQCLLEDSVVVTTHELPDVSLSANPVSGPSPLSVVFENTSSGNYSYVWTFGDGDTTTDNSLVVTHLFENVGDYYTILTATDQYGCENTAHQLIEVIVPDMVYVFPNIFTPNGDGQNDEFFITNLQNVDNIDIVILNRWGNIVFESSDLNFVWNGNVNNSGMECEDGVYFYKAELSNDFGEQETAHGYVHLNRNN